MSDIACVLSTGLQASRFLRATNRASWWKLSDFGYNWKLSHLRTLYRWLTNVLYQSNHDCVSDSFVLAIIETFFIAFALYLLHVQDLVSVPTYFKDNVCSNIALTYLRIKYVQLYVCKSIENHQCTCKSVKNGYKIVECGCIYLPGPLK